MYRRLLVADCQLETVNLAVLDADNFPRSKNSQDYTGTSLIDASESTENPKAQSVFYMSLSKRCKANNSQ